MTDDLETDLFQVLAVLPVANDLAKLNLSGLYKVLNYYLLSKNSRAITVVEDVCNALLAGVPYLIPFCFTRYDADSIATELRALGYQVRVVQVAS